MCYGSGSAGINELKQRHVNRLGYFGYGNSVTREKPALFASPLTNSAHIKAIVMTSYGGVVLTWSSTAAAVSQ